MKRFSSSLLAFLASFLVAASALACGQIGQSYQVLYSSVSGVATNHLVTAGECGTIFRADASNGTVTVFLPAPADFGLGMIGIKKTDFTSGLVQFKPDPAASPAFSLEMGYTSLPLSLEGDSVFLASDGSHWEVMGSNLASLRHTPLPGEHDVAVTTNYSVECPYNGFVLFGNTHTAGGSIAFWLPHVSDCVPAGTHQAFMVHLRHQDDQTTTHVISIVSKPGEAIADNRAVQMNTGAGPCTDSTYGCKIDLANNNSDIEVGTWGASTWYVISSNGE